MCYTNNQMIPQSARHNEGSLYINSASGTLFLRIMKTILRFI